MLIITDELEMKLEWTNVKCRKRVLANECFIEHFAKGSQTQFPKYKKDLLKMKTITPTPKGSIKK